MIAGLAATGTTEISHVHHLLRGYERMVEKLQGLGAAITMRPGSGLGQGQDQPHGTALAGD